LAEWYAFSRFPVYVQLKDVHAGQLDISSINITSNSTAASTFELAFDVTM
jgi:hypothetical protein